MGTIGGIIGWAIAGLVVGAIARLVVPGRQEMGLFLTMIMGVVGAILGGLVTYMVAGGDGDAVNYWPGWIMAIVGAVVVVWAYAAMGSRHHT